MSTKKYFQPRFTPDQTFQYAILSAIAAASIQLLTCCPNNFLSFLRFISITSFAAYLPSYFDGTEFTPEGRLSSIREHPFWRKYLFPKSKVMFPDGFSQRPDPSKQYIVGLSPHGVLSACHWFANTCELTSIFGPNRRSLGGSVIFKIPFYRDIMLAGGIVDASRENTEQLLEQGKTVVILPGGISEQVRTQYNKQSIYITKRKGMFKFALQYDLPIVPLYSMNEVSLLHTYDYLRKLRIWIADKLWIPICFSGVSMLRDEIPIYGGNPVYLQKKGPKPTIDEINQLQQMYIDEVKRIYYTFRDKHGFGNIDLEIL